MGPYAKKLTTIQVHCSQCAPMPPPCNPDQSCLARFPLLHAIFSLRVRLSNIVSPSMSMLQVKSHLQKHRIKEARSRWMAQPASTDRQALAESTAPAASTVPLQHAAPNASQQGCASPAELFMVPMMDTSPVKRRKAQHSPPESNSSPAQPGQAPQQLFWLTADAAQAVGVPGLCGASGLPLAVPGRDIIRRASSLPASAGCSPKSQQFLAAARSGSCSSSGVHVDLHQLLSAQRELPGSISSGPSPSLMWPNVNVNTNAAVIMAPALPPPLATLDQIGTVVSCKPPTASAAAAQVPLMPPPQLLSPFDASSFLDEDDVDFLLSLE